MHKEPGSSVIFEQEYKVGRFRRFLEPTEPDDPERGSNPAKRTQRLLQFYEPDERASTGRVYSGVMHTVAVADIADVSKKPFTNI